MYGGSRESWICKELYQNLTSHKLHDIVTQHKGRQSSPTRMTWHTKIRAVSRYALPTHYNYSYDPAGGWAVWFCTKTTITAEKLHAYHQHWSPSSALAYWKTEQDLRSSSSKDFHPRDPCRETHESDREGSREESNDAQNLWHRIDLCEHGDGDGGKETGYDCCECGRNA